MHHRDPAIDRLRGLVMILMVLDHSGAIFDGGHLASDSALFYREGSPLPLDRFLLRLVTHLCAPTFVFLAGMSLFSSVVRRSAGGRSSRSIDRHLLARGVSLIALEFVVVSTSWTPVYAGEFMIFLQVIWAIGVAFLLMIPLRRLPAGVLAGGALAYLFVSDWFVLDVLGFLSPSREMPLWGGLLGAYDSFRFLGVQWVSVYPILPWSSMLVLGWCFGSYVDWKRSNGEDPAENCYAFGLLALIAFVVLRWADGYGNMGLGREDGSFAQWLHVSKYPPSLSFVALTLGAMAVLLSLFWVRDRLRVPDLEPNGVLEVYGRTPLLFYLLHLPMIVVLAKLAGYERPGEGGLVETFLAVVLVCAILLPICSAYGRVKASRRFRWTRLL